MSQSPTITTILPKNSFKFLRRSLPIKRITNKMLKEVNLRRFHLKNIQNIISNDDEPSLKLNTHKYLHKKTLKSLRKAQVFYMRELNWLNALKNAKNLQEIQIKINLDDLKAIPGFHDTFTALERVFQCLKKFPKNIRSVSIQAEGLNLKKGHVQKIYRILGSFKRLEKVKRIFGAARAEGFVEKEYRVAKRYMRRCLYLKSFEYNPYGYEDDGYWMGFENLYHPYNGRKDQNGYLRLMKERRKFEFVTSLKLPINTKYFSNYLRYEEFLRDAKDLQVVSSESESSDESEDEEIDPGTQKILQDRNKKMMEVRLARTLLLFFRFELYPNLRILRLDMSKNSLYYFTSSIGNCFAMLQQLKELDMALPKNPRGSKFLFKAFLKLPLLMKFGLVISIFKEEEMKLLAKFLEKQKDLTGLMLNNDWIHEDTKSYRLQEDFIRDMGSYLAMNKNLKDLSLLFGGSSLSSISNSFQKMPECKNQIRSLTLGFYDHTVCGTETVRSFCDFLGNQEDSLRSLFLEFNFIVNSEALGAICQGITKLKRLRSLEFFVNEIGEPLKKTYLRFFKETLKEKSPLALRPNVKEYRTWLLQLAKMLPKIQESLEVLTLKVGRLTVFDEKFVGEYLKVIESLKGMKILKNLSINVPFSKMKKEEKEKLKEGIMKLNNVRSILAEPFIGNDDDDGDEGNGRRAADDDEFLFVAAEVNNRQARKHSLFF